jgi:hypothetical protein
VRGVGGRIRPTLGGPIPPKLIAESVARAVRQGGIRVGSLSTEVVDAGTPSLSLWSRRGTSSGSRDAAEGGSI